MRLSKQRIRVASVAPGGLALLALAFVLLPWGRQDPGKQGPACEERADDVTFPVQIAVARTGDLVKRLPTSGILRANREVEIRSRVAGSLTAVSAHDGKFVRPAERLAAIDDREYRVAYDRARANLLNAQIEFRSLSATPFLTPVDSMEARRRVEKESRTLDSLTRLHLSRRIDDDTFERKSRETEAALAYLSANRGDVIAGRSGLAQAREAFENAKMNIEATSISAPFAGYVADCLLANGMHVNAGQILLKILDLSTILVDVDILESEIGRVAVGQKARARAAGLPEIEFEGSVRTLNPLVDAKAGTMKATIALAGRARDGKLPRSHLRPGMFASVLVETRTFLHLLLVPREAVLVRDQRPLVFTVKGSLAKWHYVETGERNEEFIEIRSGLSPGDTVIVGGHYTLAHDAKVSVLTGSH
jgi:membrane fusion protein (multidrug efflux system)